MKRELTCIVCPRGCALQVETDGEKVISVAGFTCRRGQEYAVSECTNPVRTLTTTAAMRSGNVVPVKTDKPIPKALLFRCMEEINRLQLPDHVQYGDVLIENVLGTGANVIAVKTVSAGQS